MSYQSDVGRSRQVREREGKINIKATPRPAPAQPVKIITNSINICDIIDNKDILL